MSQFYFYSAKSQSVQRTTLYILIPLVQERKNSPKILFNMAEVELLLSYFVFLMPKSELHFTFRLIFFDSSSIIIKCAN